MNWRFTWPCGRRIIAKPGYHRIALTWLQGVSSAMYAPPVVASSWLQYIDRSGGSIVYVRAVKPAESGGVGQYHARSPNKENGMYGRTA